MLHKTMLVIDDTFPVVQNRSHLQSEPGGQNMRTAGNAIWFICGGIVMGLAWGILGCVFMISIIGIPWAKASFVIAGFTFFPFGKEAISRSELTREEDIGTGIAGMLGNIIWFILAGIWLAIGHVSSAIMCFITIIGIPPITGKCSNSICTN